MRLVIQHSTIRAKTGFDSQAESTGEESGYSLSISFYAGKYYFVLVQLEYLNYCAVRAMLLRGNHNMKFWILC